MNRLWLALLIVLWLGSVASAQTIVDSTKRFCWNQPATTGITGYKLYYGTASGAYTQNIDVGIGLTATQVPKTDPACNVYSKTLGELAIAPGTYYFNVVNYDATKVESAKDGEVSFFLPRPGPTGLQLVPGQ